MTAKKRLIAAERKREIMNSAAKVISKKGLEKATMEEIIGRDYFIQRGCISLLWERE